MSWTVNALKLARHDDHYNSGRLDYESGYVAVVIGLESEASGQTHDNQMQLVVGFMNPAARKWSASINWKCGDESGSETVDIPKVKSTSARQVDKQLALVPKSRGKTLRASVAFALVGHEEDDTCASSCSC